MRRQRRRWGQIELAPWAVPAGGDAARRGDGPQPARELTRPTKPSDRLSHDQYVTDQGVIG